MRKIVRYIKKYYADQNKKLLAASACFVALLIFLNYRFAIDDSISDITSFSSRVFYRYIIYLLAFTFPCLLYGWMNKKNYFQEKRFLLLLLVAPVVFSAKASADFYFHFSSNLVQNLYWNIVTFWPIVLIAILLFIFVCWKLFDSNQPFYGCSNKNIDWKPYWAMLLIMAPLIVAAASLPDFQSSYPKIKILTAFSSHSFSIWEKLLFELSYSSDFLGIEIFFRGFLVLAFAKWAGKDAILPMACFYCCIHFGKPLGECISSWFGGLLLGIIAYETKSIWGGIMIHLGIAWLMEIAGYLFE